MVLSPNGPKGPKGLISLLFSLYHDTTPTNI